MRVSAPIVTLLTNPITSAFAASSSFFLTQPRAAFATTTKKPTRAPAFGTCKEQERVSPSSFSSTATAKDMTTTGTEEETKSEFSVMDELTQTLQTLTHLSRASAILDYDEKVFMPHTEAAAKDRGLQQAALATVLHEKSTDSKLGHLLTQAEQQQEGEEKTEAEASGSSEREKRIVQLARKAYDKKVLIPTKLAAEKAALSSESYAVWAKARAADDYSQFQPVFGRCIDMAIQITQAQHPQQQEKDGLYGKMLDEYEVGMDPARIDHIFAQIKTALVPLIEAVVQSPHPPSKEPLNGHFPLDKQQKLNQQLVRAIGFDDSNGRIDVSVHPFTMGISPKDVRITSRFNENEWYQGLAGSIHEGGHAIYEQNLGDSGLPIDAALSMGMHESQSLFWERHIGLSKPFWKYATPIVNGNLDTTFTDVDLYGAVNAVSPSLIRVEADELTYPLHVILRYGIERDLIEGRLDVADVPQRWNREMKELLGVDVPSDAKGCLQDIHWAMLAYGYFPTYLIGAASAAQLAHYCKIDIPDMDQKIENGDFAEIKSWLTDKVHRHGSMYKSLDEHFEDQLGEKLNPTYFIQYLVNKYNDLYKL